MKASERIQEDLDNKLKLESDLAKELKRIFKTIKNDFKRQVSNYGIAFEFEQWQTLFYDTYLAHYKKVGAVFSNSLERQYDIEVRPDEKSLIDNALALFFLTSAQSAADEATKTTVKDADSSLAIAREQQSVSIEEGDIFTQATLAVVGASVFDKKLKGRTSVIKVTETTKPAEASKLVEAQVIDAGVTNINDPTLFVYMESLKDWYGILDNRIRDTHVEADRKQKGVPISQPFRVGESLLMYPGDTSLGAQKKETMHCRCSALYRPSDQNLSRRKK